MVENANQTPVDSIALPEKWKKADLDASMSEPRGAG